MRNSKNIYKLAGCFALVAVLTAACMRPAEPIREEAKPIESTVKVPAYDPLGLAQDTVNIPAQLAGASREPEALAGRPPSEDTTQYQIYRVQLQTYEAYGDGRRGLQVAEEIFDQPALLDYDIPYFKLRVGEFKSRAAAEAYAQKARTVGYANALVVTATIGVQQAPTLYDHEKAPSDSSSAPTAPRKNG